MNNVIANLIQTQTRVNIPSFGAFIVNRDGEKAEILFNQYLNFDDGVLSAAVIEQKGLSKEDADEQIAQYVEDLNRRLDSGETVSIEGVGSFVKDGVRVEFTADDSAAAPVQAEEQEPAKEDSDAITLDFEPTPTATSAEETESEEPKAAADYTETTTNTTNTTTNNYYYEEKPKRTLLWVLLIVLLLLIALVLCLFVFNKDNAVYRLFFPPEVEAVEQPAPVTVDTTAVVEPDTLAQKEAAEVITTERRYNIVVGTYDIKEVAQKRVDALRARGFDKAELATFRGKYVAVIESYSSLVEAESRQEYIVDTYRIESYITNGGE